MYFKLSRNSAGKGGSLKTENTKIYYPNSWFSANQVGKFFGNQSPIESTNATIFSVLDGSGWKPELPSPKLESLPPHLDKIKPSKN